ncbi:hypothetical protein ACQP1V_28940 [Microtetraspora malaysiensis]|uniref:hypothetical protein n=1 Tax=Microtetraspora malaysiensis TaxID=161358 RepID=UPI003D8E36F1
MSATLPGRPVLRPARHTSGYAARNSGRPGMCSMAISAVDRALWDLKACQLGLPLHRRLGAVHDGYPCTAQAASRRAARHACANSSTTGPETRGSLT